MWPRSLGVEVLEVWSRYRRGDSVGKKMERGVHGRKRRTLGENKAGIGPFGGRNDGGIRAAFEVVSAGEGKMISER